MEAAQLSWRCPMLEAFRPGTRRGVADEAVLRADIGRRPGRGSPPRRGNRSRPDRPRTVDGSCPRTTARRRLATKRVKRPPGRASSGRRNHLPVASSLRDSRPKSRLRIGPVRAIPRPTGARSRLFNRPSAAIPARTRTGADRRVAAAATRPHDRTGRGAGQSRRRWRAATSRRS